MNTNTRSPCPGHAASAIVLAGVIIAAGALQPSHAGDYPDVDHAASGSDATVRSEHATRRSGDRSDFSVMEPVPVAPPPPGDNAFGQDIQGPIDPTYMEPDVLDGDARD